MTPPTKAIVIAAGRGRRLAPYTDEMPKCLVPVGASDLPILGWQLDAFAAAGVTEVVIIRGYLAPVLTARAPALCRDRGLTVRFVDNHAWAHNNILQSLFTARAELDGPVYLTYSDIVFTRQVVAALAAASGDACLIIDRDFRQIYEGRTDHPLEEAEVAAVAAGGDRGHSADSAAGHAAAARVTRVGKRALPAAEAWGEFIGLIKLSALGARWLTERWDELVREYAGREAAPFMRAAAFRDAYLTDLLQDLIERGHPLTPVGIRGQWREIDTVQDLTRAQALLGCDQEDWT